VVVLTGPEGDVNDFTLTAVTNSVDDEPTTTALTDVDFSTTSQVATDAVFFINGQQITRSNNRVSDALEGVTIELFTATSSAARIEMQRETAGIQERLQGLVTAYNDFNDALKILGDRKSEVESFGGALAGDSILSSFRAQIRDMVISTSSTPGDTVQAVRHVGLSLDRFGVLTLDSTKLETALEDNFEEVVTMLTGNTDNQSVYNPADAGVAGDASKIIEKMLRSTGQLAVQTETAGQKIEDHQAELVKLEARMQKILERYIAQFSVMDNIVGNSNSVRTNLQSSFDGMAASYSRR
jgi:flagellar hook-associated protein 2